MTGFQPFENSYLQFVTIAFSVKFCKFANLAVLLTMTIFKDALKQKVSK